MNSEGCDPAFVAVDFFCGAGGTTRGLIDAGGYVIAGIDKDASCEKTYRENNRNTSLDRNLPTFLSMDVFPRSDDYPDGEQQSAIDRLRELIPKFEHRDLRTPLLFTICAPCQSFTKFTQRRLTPRRQNQRHRDESLLLQALPFITEFSPQLIICENVPGIQRGKYRPIWDEFIRHLHACGYAVSSGVVCASDFGVPQRRRRTILVASRQDAELPRLPDRDSQSKGNTVEDAIGGMHPLRPGETSASDPLHRCRDLSSLNRKRLASVKPGETNRVLDNSPHGDLSLACHRRMGTGGSRGFGDVYTRMRPDLPSPTITTRFYSVSNGRFGHFDPSQTRALSLREGAMLQGFKSDYMFYARSMDSAARMIGNAVPPPLSQFFATWLLREWEGHS